MTATERRQLINERLAAIDVELTRLRIEQAFGIADIPDVKPETTLTPPVILPRGYTETLRRVRQLRAS